MNLPVRKKRSWTWVVILGVAVLCASALPVSWFVVAWNRHAADKACGDHLRQIGLALQQYHVAFGSFPPAYVMNESGERWHSWRVLILPYLGQNALHKRYRFDEPWNGKHNRLLLDQMPAVYSCSVLQQKRSTNYVAIVGAQTVWPEHLSMKYWDISDGTSNTLQLIEAAGADIPWTEPRDLVYKELRTGSSALQFEQSGVHFKAMRTLLADGSVRAISWQLDRKTFAALCSAASGRPFPGLGGDLPMQMVEEIEQVPLPATELRRTGIAPHLNVPLVQGRNAVYCATFQIAWDRLRDDVVNEPIRLSGNPALSSELNAHGFPRSSLSADSYVAIAGLGSDGTVNQIRSEMAKKFPSFPARLVPTSENAIVAYAFLQKRLPFALSFDRLAKPLNIRETNRVVNVFSFGIQDVASHGPREEELRKQVTVLDYVNDDDFVIRLVTPREYVVLAKVSRNGTLGEMLADVRGRVTRPRGRNVSPELAIEETIAVPLLSLFVEQEYQELMGRTLQNQRFSGLPIVSARQLIHFQLDESGAILESEAELQFLNGDEPPPRPRHFVFDEPFLIYLQESPSQEPYLVMWVENSELMVLSGR